MASGLGIRIDKEEALERSRCSWSPLIPFVPWRTPFCSNPLSSSPSDLAPLLLLGGSPASPFPPLFLAPDSGKCQWGCVGPYWEGGKNFRPETGRGCWKEGPGEGWWLQRWVGVESGLLGVGIGDPHPQRSFQAVRGMHKVRGQRVRQPPSQAEAGVQYGKRDGWFGGGSFRPDPDVAFPGLCAVPVNLGGASGPRHPRPQSLAANDDRTE